MAMTFEKYLAAARFMAEQGRIARERKAAFEERERLRKEAEREADFKKHFLPQPISVGAPAPLSQGPNQPMPMQTGLGMPGFTPDAPAALLQQPGQLRQTGLGVQQPPMPGVTVPGIPQHNIMSPPNFNEAMARAYAADPTYAGSILGSGGVRELMEMAQGPKPYQPTVHKGPHGGLYESEKGGGLKKVVGGKAAGEEKPKTLALEKELLAIQKKLSALYEAIYPDPDEVSGLEERQDELLNALYAATDAERPEELYESYVKWLKKNNLEDTPENKTYFYQEAKKQE
jgi:hypothetical protein